MQKKTILQLAIFFFTMLIILIFFNVYFNRDNVNKKSSAIEENNTDIRKKGSKNNLIKDIYYVSSDSNGNIYEIMSKEGEIDIQDASIISMTDVVAKLLFTDSDPINITSKYAKYNNETYETSFFENVRVKYLEHNIKTENMHLSTQKNLISLNKNIIYDYFNTRLLADRVEIDLLTKDSRIFMNNDIKKVEIIGQSDNGNN